MDGLILKKGGKLYAKKWRKGKETYKNVTKVAYRCLFEYCELDDDLTLRDVFLLLKSNLDMFDSILGNWCKEYVECAFSKRYKHDPKKDNIDFLELYFHIEENNSKEYGFDTWGFNFPCFHGYGIVKQDEQDNSGHVYQKKGDKVDWSIQFTETWKLASYPLKLKKDVTIMRDLLNKKKPPFEEEVCTLKNVQYTLGQILNGIIWELSWSGSPIRTKEFRKELDRRVQSIEDGTAELIPWETVKENMNKLIEKAKVKQAKKKKEGSGGGIAVPNKKG